MNTKLILLTCFLALVAMAAAIAQSIQFELVTTPPFADFDRVAGGGIAFADVDGDLDQDVLITGSNYARFITKLYTNDGNGNFSEMTGTPFIGVAAGSLAFADVDGDQDQDVVITGQSDDSGYITRLYTNDGTGMFTEVTGTSFEEVYYSTVTFADVDGDQDQDMMLIGRNTSDLLIAKLYTNDGSGSFTEVSGTPFEEVMWGDIAFADVDGDQDQDVLITGYNGSFLITKLYLNDGSGIFSEMMATPFVGGWTNALAFADVDGDQDQDVLIAGGNQSQVGTVTLYLNDGSGIFSEVMATPFEGGGDGSVAFADVDGDGDQDVLVTGADKYDTPIMFANLYLNDGSGTFSKASGTPFEGVWISAVAVADVDGDQDQDVVITGVNNDDINTAWLYLNDGSAGFTKVTEKPFEGVNVSSIAFADVDGDLDQDVLITGHSNNDEGIAKLYSNDGNGNFSEMIGTPFIEVADGSLAFADVDGDQDQDVLITGRNNNNESIAKLYTNDGSGSFTEVLGTSFVGVSEGAFAFADVDGDQDQDVLITGWTGSDRIAKLYTNDGNGIFSEVSGTPFEGVYDSSIAFADVDGDQDQDVLITGWTESNPINNIAKLYLNDGSGIFTEVAGTPFEKVHQSSLGFADVDGDLDQDVLITGNSSSGMTARLYTNNGSGNFSEVSGTPFVGVHHGSLAFADVDGDQDQDVLITGTTDLSSTGLFTRLYSNDGSGNFTEVSGMPFVAVAYGSIAFADMNGDQDQDVLLTGSSEGGATTKLYRNISSRTGILNEPSVDGVTLGQNYPNPFTSRTSISYTLSKAGWVDLAIYDLQGRKVVQLPRKYITAGKYAFVFQSGHLPGGVYIYRLLADGILINKRMIIVK